MRRLYAVILGACLGLALLEIGFRAGSLVVSGHTYGGGVDRSEAYPARLERILNAATDRRAFTVVNLGVPGTNSAQTLHRLPEYVELYEPDLLVVLTGVNDYWNPAEVVAGADEGPWQRLHRWLSHVRVYRFVLLTLERAGSSPGGEGEGKARRTGEAQPSADGAQPTLAVLQRGPDDGGDAEATHRELRYGGAAFHFLVPTRAGVLDDAAHERLLRRHLAGIVGAGSAAGVPVVLPTYAADWGHYRVANRAIRSMADTRGALVVPQEYGANLARRIRDAPAGESLFFPDLHPRPPVYTAFAENLCETLVRERLIPLDRCAPRASSG
jgi:hypothetical protein